MPFIGFAGTWPGRSPTRALLDYVQAATPSRTGAASVIASSDSRCNAPALATASGVTVALQGKPVWLDGAGVSSTAPAARILADYQRLDSRFLDGMYGSFAVAVIDDRAGTVLLALDRMGIERMAYATRGEGIVFSHSCEVLARFPGMDAPLRPQALFDYLLLHMIPAPDSAYEGVRKLQPGTCATFRRGELTIRRYWQPAFVESRVDTEADLEAQLRSSLRIGVERCRPDADTGAFLSGGLDSSSVAGMLSVVAGGARTFSIGFGVDAYNELEFARVAARRFGFDSREYQVTAADVVAAFPLIAAAYDEPFGNSSAVPTYFCAKVAAEAGVTHLLAGDGGDEIFGGNERYARQRTFEVYGRLPRPMRQYLIEPLVAQLNPDSRIMPLRKLRSYVDQARIRLPERLECWNYMYRADLDSMLDAEFRASIEPRAALELMTAVYDSAQCDSLLNRMLHYDWQFTLSDNDLRKVGAMCSLANVQVSYPMLDPAVVDLSLRIPSAMKMQGSELRSFYKRAMRDFLPREILEKTKHGFGLPFGVWLQTHAPLADMIFSLLTDLKARRIIKAQFLDSLIAEQRSEHPEYSGYAIWDLAMLEAWFQARTAGRVQTAA